MKTYLFAVQLLLISLKVVGQPLSDGKCDYIWKTGYDGYAADSNFKHMTLNFNTLPFTINTTTDTASFLAMSAIISDSLGNLVCYTNGAFLYDRNNVKMRLDTLNPGYYARGSDPTLLCYNFPQTAVILAKPNNPNEYYLFHERIAAPIPTFNGSLGEDFFYTVVDARLRNGLGGVASWRNLIVRDTLEQCKINAVRHANGRDWWITAWHIGFDKYRLCLLDPSGVHDLGWKYVPNTTWVSGFGQSFFSPNGNVFARTTYDVSANKSRIDVLDFDRCTGTLTNRAQFHSPFSNIISLGLSMSPNSRYLYISQSSYVLQYDLQAATIATTIDTVAVWDGTRDIIYPFLPVLFWTHQLAPDGKIYISTGNGTHYMHTIDNPDIGGVGCNVRQHSVRLPAFAFRTLPNFPNFRLGAVAGSVCDTLGYSATNLQKAQVLKVFPNPTSGIIHIENLPPQARVVVYDALGREVSVYKNINNQTIELPLRLANGVYYLTIRDENNLFYNGKLVLVRE